MIKDGYSSKYHTGKICINAGCKSPAGTAWTKLWCASCDKERKERISESIESIARSMKS